ncbi:MAG: flagellar protein FlgJ [Paraglaciecola sp.]|jgi:flagellar protein FlgJ
MEPSNNFKGQLELSRNANDIAGLDTLRRAAQSGDKKALKEAAQQFEGIFVQMMLKSMRKAQDVMADKDSPFNSEQVKFYRDMHDQQLANDLSSNGSIGLADIIVRQLGQLGDGYMPASAIRNDGNLSSINRQSIKSVDSAQSAVLGTKNVREQEPKTFQAFKHAAFDTPQEFVSQLLPAAKQAAEQLGLDPLAMIAQAAVETGWGKHMIHTDLGKNTHNLFGIKANQHWQGDKTMVSTVEYENGLATQKKAPFRTYDSFSEGMQDYVDFLKENPRYQRALNNSHDAKSYFKELQQAGYATDPGYAEKVLSVLQGNNLAEFMP